MNSKDITLTENAFRFILNNYNGNFEGVRFIEHITKNMVSRIRLLMNLHGSALQLSFTTGSKLKLPVKVDIDMLKLLLN